MVTNPWILLSLVAFSVVVTLASQWLVARMQRSASGSSPGVGGLAADLLWMLIIFAGALVAVRYIERLPDPNPGFFAFGLAALCLSLLRSALYQRSRQSQSTLQGWDVQELGRRALRSLIFPMFAVTVYLSLAWLLRTPADPVLFLPLCLGTLLPGLDSETSTLGRLLPFVSHRLNARFGNQQEWHSLGAAALVAVITLPLVLVTNLLVWALIPLGFVSRLILELLYSTGIMLFWPLTRTRYRILGAPLGAPGSPLEYRLALGLGGLVIVLLFVVDLGPPAQQPTAVPCYEETVERYYAMRGKNLVVADIEGTWQASGRRVTGRYEILNAVGDSFVMLERYTGRVFTAGRGPADNLYLNRLNLGTGPQVRIKAVEIELHDQTLAEALPILYEMQREPGLQHIYVSGALKALTAQDTASPVLPVDYSQTTLPRIETDEGGNRRLQYLTAGQLIELADVPVEHAGLVITATYITPPEGPTVTPLPSPSPEATPGSPEGERTP